MQSEYTDAGQETYQFAGGLMTVLVDGAFTGGCYSLLLAHIPPGNATPPHFHDVDTEALVMLAGGMTVETPGRLAILNAGEAAVLPAAQVHRLSNAGKEDANYLLLCAPSGFEEFVRRVGTRIDHTSAAPAQMKEEDVRVMVECASVFGVRLTDGAELTRPVTNEHPVVPHETFVAFGTTIEILASIDDGRDGINLIRATAITPKGGQLTPQTSEMSTNTRFFAGTSALNGSRYGECASASVPALLAVTTGDVLRHLREHVISELMIADGGPLGRLLLVLTALHASGARNGLDGVPSLCAALPARRGFPIR